MMAKHHSTFYFDETPVVIQVENTLFKVHKYHLLQSETFSDMFKLPSTPADSVEGSTPDQPIVLNGVTASDFEALLTVLYMRHCSNNRPSLTASLITSAFRLAHMWNFSDLRAHLLTRAEETLDDVGKIEFANEFSMYKWLLPAYLNLCRRSAPPTTDEATRLGIHGLLMVFRLREHYRPWDPLEASKHDLSGSEAYCNECFGYSYNSGFSFLQPTSPRQCTGCGNESKSYFHPKQAPGSNRSEDSLETQLKTWIQGGCKSE